MEIGAWVNAKIDVQKIVCSSVFWIVPLHIKVFTALLCQGSAAGINVAVILHHALRYHFQWNLREALLKII